MQELLISFQHLEVSPLPLSYSKASLLLGCGRFYRLRYMEKREEDQNAILDRESAQVGKFLHTVLEYCMTKAQRFGFEMDSVDFGLTWKQAADQMRLCHAEYNRAMEMRTTTANLLAQLLELIKKYHLRVTPELRFCMSKTGVVTANVPYHSRAFIGFLDFWGVTANQRAGLLLDYKSHFKSAENQESLVMQTMLYLYFMFRMHPQVQTIQTGGVYLPEDLLDLHQIVRREEMPRIEDEVKKFLAAFYQAYSRSEFKPTQSKYCKWCGYIGTCPLKPKK